MKYMKLQSKYAYVGGERLENTLRRLGTQVLDEIVQGFGSPCKQGYGQISMGRMSEHARNAGTLDESVTKSVA